MSARVWDFGDLLDHDVLYLKNLDFRIKRT